MDDAPARFDLGSRSLREHAARGSLVNAAFSAGLSLIGLIRAFALAVFLTRTDYGVWGVLAVSLGTVLWLKQAGVGDRFIQQDEHDQEREFQRAFTLELLATGAFVVLLLALLPLFCLLYGEWELLAPGLVIVLALVPTGVMQAPLWVFYRRMDFVRQRTLQAIEPVVALVVSVALAALGLGYWAIVLGMVAGGWAMAAAAAASSPYPLRWRYDPGALRSYWSFSWPLFVTSGATVVAAQLAVLATEAHLGLAAVGAMALASQVTQFTHRVDALVTGTLYPAICAVRDRLDLLAESFVKSNRLGLMWAMPFGAGLALFCGDLVTYVLGEEWRPAVELLQVYGVVAAVGHLAFNWDAYLRARGDTRPLAVAAVASTVAFVACGLPLLLLFDLRGLAAAIAIQTAVHVAFRALYLRRLFHGLRYLAHAGRAMAPTLPAAAAVLLLRHLGGGERTVGDVMIELGAYALVAALVTWRLERGLLREAAGYLRPAAA
ncbi:MAG TPA: oligosaccharide flippase family protein [Solirubrobacteraceae bacterium]|nr:oligosaccharide flippase family protein [Solirubrobacteraceae bacterium]